MKHTKAPPIALLLAAAFLVAPSSTRAADAPPFDPTPVDLSTLTPMPGVRIASTLTATDKSPVQLTAHAVFEAGKPAVVVQYFAVYVATRTPSGTLQLDRLAYVKVDQGSTIEFRPQAATKVVIYGGDKPFLPISLDNDRLPVPPPIAPPAPKAKPAPRAPASGDGGTV